LLPPTYPQHIHNWGLDTDRDNSVMLANILTAGPFGPSPQIGVWP
jgi:hypothetical protein